MHVDLYRLAGGTELEGLGLRELDRSGWVWLIEWPERALEHLPVADLEWELTPVAGAGRTLAVRAATPIGERWLHAAVPLTMSSIT